MFDRRKKDDAYQSTRGKSQDLICGDEKNFYSSKRFEGDLFLNTKERTSVSPILIQKQSMKEVMNHQEQKIEPSFKITNQILVLPQPAIPEEYDRTKATIKGIGNKIFQPILKAKQQQRNQGTDFNNDNNIFVSHFSYLSNPILDNYVQTSTEAA